MFFSFSYCHTIWIMEKKEDGILAHPSQIGTMLTQNIDAYRSFLFFRSFLRCLHYEQNFFCEISANVTMTTKNNIIIIIINTSG